MFARQTIPFGESVSPTVHDFHDDNLEPEEGLDKSTPLKVFRSPGRVTRTRRVSGASAPKLNDLPTDGKSI